MPHNPHADFTPTLKGYSGQEPFRFWCQLALPLTYDDSLSYYELLNKVVTYLNHTIEDVSNMETNVGALHDAYVQLQNYVNEYFDNIDIEDELKNILDEMALDGRLDAILDPIFSNYLQKNIPFVIPEMFGAIGDGIADDTEAIQTAIDNSDYVIFPSEKYLFHNVAIHRPITLDFRQAILLSQAPDNPLGESIDFTITADDIDGITIHGGVFQRPGSEPCIKRVNTDVTYTNPVTHEVSMLGTVATYALNTTGIFLLNNCKNVKFDRCRFKESMTFSNIRCVSCRDVEITRCYTERYHGANFAFIDDCVNIKVHNCEMHNGKQIKLTDAYNSQPFIYAVCTGFQHYKPSTGDPTYFYDGIKDYEVSNCRIIESDWEGIDSHGGTNIRFINNYIENCFRWITCYSDSRPALNPGVRFGNVTIENNECRNPLNGYSEVVSVYMSEGRAKITTYKPVAMLLHGDQYDDENAENYTVKSNMFINPCIHSTYGIFNAYAIRNLLIIQNLIDFTYKTQLPEQYQNINDFIRLIYNYDAVFSQNRIINHPSKSSIFRLNCSSATIHNNEVFNSPLISRTSKLIEIAEIANTDPQLYRKAYASISGNRGTYVATVITSQPRLYAANEFVISSAGMTGKITKGDVGLRPINAENYPDIQDIAKVSDDDKTKIWLPEAMNKFIPGEVLSYFGDQITHIITNVEKNYIHINPATTLDFGATVNLHNSTHTLLTVFTP